MDYAAEMAADAKLSPQALALGRELLTRASEQGYKSEYWPIISKLIG
jgi:hypothetical protein